MSYGSGKGGRGKGGRDSYDSYDGRDDRDYRGSGGYDRGGGDRSSYDRGSYDRGGYDRGSYDRGSYDRDGGYDRNGRGGRGYNNRGGYDRGGYDRGDYEDQGNVGARATGVGRVSALKEGFGFIDPDELASPRIFFHFRDVRDNKQPRVGDEVRYVVELDRRSGREAAMRVDILPPGTLPKPPPPPEMVLQGVVKRAGRDGQIEQGAPVAAEGGSGSGAAASDGEQRPPTPRGTVYHYSASEAPNDGPPLQEGDLVEFSVVLGDRGGGGGEDDRGGGKGKGGKGGRSGRQALKLKLLKAGGGLPRFQGAVSSLKEHFGFLRQADGPGEVFFHFSELPRELRDANGGGGGKGGSQADRQAEGGGGEGGGGLRVGDEIEFCKGKDARSGKESATRLARLPPGTVHFEVVLPQRFEGTVATPLPPPGSGDGRSLLASSASRVEKLAYGGALKALPTAAAAAAAPSAASAEAPAPAPAATPVPADEVAPAAATGLLSPGGTKRSSWADEEDEEDEAAAGLAAEAEKAAEGAAKAAEAAAEVAEVAEASAIAERLRSALAHLPADATRAPSGKERLGFGAADLDEPFRSEGLYEGDGVEFSLAVEKSGGVRGATGIRLVRANWQRGLVTTVRERERCVPAECPRRLLPPSAMLPSPPAFARRHVTRPPFSSPPPSRLPFRCLPCRASPRPIRAHLALPPLRSSLPPETG